MKNLKDLNCNNGTGKTEMCTGSGCYRRTSFIYQYNSNDRFYNFRLYSTVLVAVVLREGRSSARMLLHQEGTGQGLLL